MKKKLPISRLRKKAWIVFSTYIRRKGADHDGNVVCVTCGKRDFWKRVNSGHFIHGHCKATFLEEINVHVQCIVCNLYKSGNLIPYYDFMLETYGKEKVAWLKSLSHATFKPSRDYYDSIIEKYRPLVDGFGA